MVSPKKIDTSNLEAMLTEIEGRRGYKDEAIKTRLRIIAADLVNEQIQTSQFQLNEENKQKLLFALSVNNKDQLEGFSSNLISALAAKNRLNNEDILTEREMIILQSNINEHASALLNIEDPPAFNGGRISKSKIDIVNRALEREVLTEVINGETILIPERELDINFRNVLELFKAKSDEKLENERRLVGEIKDNLTKDNLVQKTLSELSLEKLQIALSYLYVPIMNNFNQDPVIAFNLDDVTNSLEFNEAREAFASEDDTEDDTDNEDDYAPPLRAASPTPSAFSIERLTFAEKSKDDNYCMLDAFNYALKNINNLADIDDDPSRIGIIKNVLLYIIGSICGVDGLTEDQSLLETINGGTGYEIHQDYLPSLKQVINDMEHGDIKEFSLEELGLVSSIRKLSAPRKVEINASYKKIDSTPLTRSDSLSIVDLLAEKINVALKSNDLSSIYKLSTEFQYAHILPNGNGRVSQIIRDVCALTIGELPFMGLTPDSWYLMHNESISSDYLKYMQDNYEELLLLLQDDKLIDYKSLALAQSLSNQYQESDNIYIKADLENFKSLVISHIASRSQKARL